MSASLANHPLTRTHRWRAFWTGPRDAEQVIELLSLLGCDWPRADAFRGALMRGRMGERIDHERYLRQQAKKQNWTAEQADGLVALLLEHAGYLHSHGQSLAMAQHAFPRPA